MDSLRDNINKLIQKTLTMEDPTDPKLQSQPMYDSDDNTVDYSEEILENSQQQPEKNQNFSQQQAPADKIVNRHKVRYTATRIKYSPTRIKSRNFLSNISYTGISKKDIYNENLMLDVYVLLVKNLNPFSLRGKLQIKQSTRWSICSGETVFLQNFIDISARRKISFISTVEMLDNQVCWR